MYLLNGLKGTSMNTAWTHNKTTLHTTLSTKIPTIHYYPTESH